jgi:ribosomal protein S18 acetylase RimI-like enzyme
MQPNDIVSGTVTDSLRFERFDKTRHDRDLFDCGNPALNDFLKKNLNQQMKRGITVGYVLATQEGRIAGYVTLSSGEIPVAVFPVGLKYPPVLGVPTTLVGRLAVDRDFQKRGHGSELLIYAIRKAVEVSRDIASAVIEVDALDDPARAFYEHYGFRGLLDDKLHMYLPMADAATLVRNVFQEK